ncbi:MAG TPA: hypothetical protein VKA96_06860 [Solirubrobacteraceae bacterium]|jgi:hypothetical protein|nr:hypothetical protein [Solirubrobacteraceae bacterium]
MGARSVVLGLALLFTVTLAALTLWVAVRQGFDILVLVSLVVVGLFAFGIVGALLHPPDE